MVSTTGLPVSDLDGEEAGGFVVINVDAPSRNPYQILEEDGGGYFPTLRQARAACRGWREESGNDQIFVYALLGIREATDEHPESFPLE